MIPSIQRRHIKENEMSEFIKKTSTTTINKYKLVSTSHSGFSPRIIMWHYINFKEWNWGKILDVSFEKPGIKIHMHKDISKGIHVQIPFIFYHETYLDIFCTYLNKYFEDKKYSKENILDMLVEIVPSENIINTTIMNVLFGDILGISGYDIPEQNIHDKNVIFAYNEYIDFITDYD